MHPDRRHVVRQRLEGERIVVEGEPDLLAREPALGVVARLRRKDWVVRLRDHHAGSASRRAIIALNAGRAWHAASHVFTFGAASSSSAAGMA